jgi:hypothetical protein
MKQQLRLLLVLLSTNFIIFSSCNKDDNPPAPKTKTQLLTQGTWKYKSATVGGTPYTIQACQQDNIYTFSAAGGGGIDEGASKCNATDPQTNSFTWNFQSGETLLYISTILFSGGSNTFTLVSLTETEAIISQGITVGGFPTQNVVVTFQH